MEELKPLTISSSSVKKPTVLLTHDFRKFLLHSPLTPEMILTEKISSMLFSQFKIPRIPTGFFKLNNKSYYCEEQFESILLFDEWNSFAWDEKRKFNQFVRPKVLFELFLIDLFFPVFSTVTRKHIVLGKKCQILGKHELFPDKNAFIFSPNTISSIGLSNPVIKRFFEPIKNELFTILEEFLVLYHDKFTADLKFQISLYPELRNSYWDNLKRCFHDEFKNYCIFTIQNFIYTYK